MGLKVHGISQVSRRLKLAGKKIPIAAYEEMVLGAMEIQDLAREFAPVDEGNLEKAIKVREEKNSLSVSVYVDGRVREKRGRKVARYATIMHESVYDLGTRSQAKADATGKEVGRKYLERAFAELENELTRAVEAALRNVL